MATTRRGQKNKTVVLTENTSSMGLHNTRSQLPVPADQVKKKRAFGDITNAINNVTENGVKRSRKAGGKKTIFVPTVVAAPTDSQPEKMETTWEVVELSQESNCSSQDSTSNTSSFDNVSVIARDWEDVDVETINDPHQVGLYVVDIFNYYRKREAKFCVGDYMTRQKDLSQNMRSILVDWLVEVQENFELNHETLYLAVKMVDIYLSRTQIARDKLQLLGATCLFIACKFDERCPPVLDDFLYICDDAYQRKELLDTEMEVLRVLDFDLGMPLSYRFLRRAARVCRASMELLTLARYILEMSLMSYDVAQKSESLVAAAALFLAATMKGQMDIWSRTLVHYTSFEKEDLLSTVTLLNNQISMPRSKNLNTIISKYSHKVFHEVALTPSLTEEQLQQLKQTKYELMELS